MSIKQSTIPAHARKQENVAHSKNKESIETGLKMVQIIKEIIINMVENLQESMLKELKYCHNESTNGKPNPKVCSG